MTEKVDKWLREARRYAKHIWCYEDLIDDHLDVSIEAALGGQDVYEFVEWLGDKYDLGRADQNWGINQNAHFNKEFSS